MTYSELAKQYQDRDFIPYHKLLSTTEWLSRRETIVERDQACCTSCYKTTSFECDDLNICFDKSDGLVPDQIQFNEIPIDIFKAQRCIQNIKIITPAKDFNLSLGLSDTGILFVSNWRELGQMGRNEIVVNTAVTNNDNKILIIDRRNKKSKIRIDSIPVISNEIVKLHVHHKYYIAGKLPWDYEDAALVTLCNWCHWKIHEETEIPIYSLVTGNLEELNYMPCYRCHGAGFFPQYKHVEGGECFRCRGRLYEELIQTKKIN